MDVETRALLIGLSRTLTKLTVNLVEEGAIDSNRAVRSFRDFAKSLGDEPHDQATRLWVNHLVETLEANPSSAKHLAVPVRALLDRQHDRSASNPDVRRNLHPRPLCAEKQTRF